MICLLLFMIGIGKYQANDNLIDAKSFNIIGYRCPGAVGCTSDAARQLKSPGFSHDSILCDGKFSVAQVGCNIKNGHPQISHDPYSDTE